MEVKADGNDLPQDPTPLTTVTFGMLMRRYCEEITPAKRGAPQEAARLKALEATALGKLTLVKLSHIDIRNYVEGRQKAVSASTINRELNILSHVLEVARRDWDHPIAENPVALIRRPKVADARTRRLAGAGEAKRLEDAFAGCRNPLIPQVIRFAMETGMRRSEILAIRWEHVQGRTLHIPVTKTGMPRTIPLSAGALRILNALKANGGPGPFPLSANAVRLAWERVRKRARVKDLRFHDLRHEAISRFFEKGLTMPEVAAISGHRDPRMLLRYTHLRPETLADKLMGLETAGGAR
ncbi:site-specific integrase [Nitrospirillum sp. BR 11163]|uniref:tyrosine-type recombinase/integrase n=1 Tax=Nitrospirillum sp. BR 11163 TaxID=3104323 RepID=UPI002AFEB450|nr:site-specific integrase [Nitrospirillum sp. BR 11163]MEA1675247.1 site-specific integrase [Nitrospirillum sp. BR 11163]